MVRRHAAPLREGRRGLRPAAEPGRAASRRRRRGAAPDPDVARARERLAASDPAEAMRLLRAALQPRPALAGRAARAGRGPARPWETRARRATPRRGPSALDEHEPAVARAAGRRLRGHGRPRGGGGRVPREPARCAPIPTCSGSWASWPPAPARLDGGGAQFRLRYDGGVTSRWAPPCWRRWAPPTPNTRGGSASVPRIRSTVVLQMEAAFQDARTPEWAAGRQRRHHPRAGAAAWTGRTPSPRGACCATSWRTPSSPRAPAATAPPGCRRASRSGSKAATPRARTPALGPRRRAGHAAPAADAGGARSRACPPPTCPAAYAESLSAVAHIIRQRGEAGVCACCRALATAFPPRKRCPWPWR